MTNSVEIEGYFITIWFSNITGFSHQDKHTADGVIVAVVAVV